MSDGKSNHKNGLTRLFDKLATKISNAVGSPYWFFFSILLVIVWFPTGFFLGFDEIWHLLINTTTTILTFLMMALLHASQKKWETRMENMQRREGTLIRNIEETSEKIVKKIPAETK